MNAWAHPTHHAKRQLDHYTHFQTTTQNVPIGYNGKPQIQFTPSPKLSFPLRRSPPKSNTPSPTPLTTPNGIWIQSAVLPQCQCADRQMGGRHFTNICTLHSYSDRERCANNMTKTSSEFIIKRLQCALPQLHCSCSCRLQVATTFYTKLSPFYIFEIWIMM